MKNIIAVDLGGTSVRAALVRNGRIVRMHKHLTQSEKGRKRVLHNIIHCIDTVGQDSKIHGIGLAVPGPANYKKGRFLKPVNLKPLWNVNLKKILEKKFKVKVRMENDANCVALAEAKKRKDKDIVILTLGTGIGSGVIIDRKLYQGKGMASELGHMIIDNGKSLEDLASGKTVTSKAKRIIGKPLLTSELCLDAKKGKKKCFNIIKETGDYLGIGLGNIANIFDPDIIVLAGGMREAGNYFLNIAKKKMTHVAILPTKVEWSRIAEPGIIGAASLFD